MEEFKDRLKEALAEKGLKQEELAILVGMTQPGINRLLRGKVKSSKALLKLADVLDVNPRWLQYGHPHPKKLRSESRQTDQKMLKPDSAVRVATRRIPVISWEAAMYGEDAVAMAKNVEEWIVVPEEGFSDKSYGLRMKGNAMSSTNPEIKSLGEGEMIACDPTQQPTHRNVVIIGLPDATEAICRRYIVEGGHPYLKANNPEWPMIKVTSEIKICARVVARLDYEL